MRKFITFLAALGLLASVSVGAIACTAPQTNSSSESSSTDGGKEWLKSDWTTLPENTNENLEYFGYFHSDGFGSLQGSYISEIAELGNANIVMINSGFTVDKALTNLAEAKAHNMKAIVSIHGFYNGGVTGKLDSLHLKEDYQEIWADYQAQMQPYIDDGTIYAFYWDEPRWNGISREDFRTLTSYVREQVPTVGTMACMTAMDIGIGNYGGVGECEDDYMEYCTDVMFDTYSDWDDSQRRLYLEMLKEKSPDDAWIWGCPKGFENEPEIKGTKPMVDHIKGQYTEAIQDERYRGIISFTYANGIEEGDWGYGLVDFFDDQSDYYDKDLRDLYIDIGCTVIGKEPPEKVDVNFIVKEATQTYALNAAVPVPEATASDANKTYDVTCVVEDPDGEAVTVTNGIFTATKAGAYKCVYTVASPTGTLKKTAYVYVKAEKEISNFEAEVYLQDATGDGADIWCWPRDISTEQAHSGNASLKVTPHPTDGTWPNVYFAYNGSDEIDLKTLGYGGVSMWLYNPGEEAIDTFGIKVNNGLGVYEGSKTIALPAKEWTEFTLTIWEMQEIAPDIDLSAVRVAITQTGGTYTNRTPFYIDDVTFMDYMEKPVTEGPTALTFEDESHIKQIHQDNDGKWCWPNAISDEQAHEGSYSLKVTPHATDGTWPQMYFKLNGSKEFDMTEFDKISLWIYNPSETVIPAFGFSALDANDVLIDKVMEIPVKVWTEFVITKSDMVAKGMDLTTISVRLGNAGASYENRTAFYIDDVVLSKAEAVVNLNEIGFESSDDLTHLVLDDDSAWAWPNRTISTEFKHDGESSLKVEPRTEAGKWPKMYFNINGQATFNMTNFDKISVWVYNPSDTEIAAFGIGIEDGSKTATNIGAIAAGQWREYVLTKEALVVAGLDITSLKVFLGNHGSDYTNRTTFYVDSVKLGSVEISNSGFEFESADDLTSITTDTWCFPGSISTEYKKEGESSLKITPHATDGSWFSVYFNFGGNQTFDMTNFDKFSLWMYNPTDADMPTFGVKITDKDGKAKEMTANAKAGEWTEYSITKAELVTAGLDLTELKVLFGNFVDLTSRSPFYIDCVRLT